jgi:hypothetical protein
MVEPVPIPATCQYRPTIGGRVIPYINVRLGDGGVDFRHHHGTRTDEVLRRGLCQVCARPLLHPLVLLCGPAALKQLLFDEPPMHPECAVYATQACPMLAGQSLRFASGPSVSEGRRGKACSEPGCDCEGWVASSTSVGRAGQPAHPWYAVYARRFSRNCDPTGRVVGALLFPEDVLRVRLVSRPGEGRCWELVPDALADYEPPQITIAPGVVAGSGNEVS